MQVLLDSHCLIWAMDDPARLGPTARATLVHRGNRLVVSIATVWEVAIKVANGRLPLSLPYRSWMEAAVKDLELAVLPITLDHAEQQTRLAFHHRDPFDRLIAAQAIEEGLPLVSADTIFDAYGVPRIWK